MIQEQGAVAIGELPRAQQGAKEVSSGGDSYFMPSRPGQFWSSGDLLLLLVPEGLGAIHGLWATSAALGARAAGLSGHRNAKGRQHFQGWGMGPGGKDAPAVKCWSIADDKQQTGKGRNGSKIPAMI